MAIDVHSEVRGRGPMLLIAIAVLGWLLAAISIWYALVIEGGREGRLEAENQRLIQETSQQRQSMTRAGELQQQADAAQAALDQAMADRSEVAQLLASTQAELQLAQQTLARVKGEVGEQQAQLAGLQDAAGKIAPQAAAAKSTIDDLDAQVASRTQELTDATAKLDAVRQQEAELRRDMAQIVHDIDDRRSEFSWFEEHAQEARAAYAEVQQQLEQTQQQLARATTDAQPSPVAQQSPAAQPSPATQAPSVPAAAEASPPPAVAAVAGTSRSVVAAAKSGAADAADATRPGSTFSDCELCPEMVVVPAGGFEMGARNLTAAERPMHHVAIHHSFGVGKYEVTFAEWDACVEDGGCKLRPDDRGWGRGTRPVTGVSWQDAADYAGWLSRKSGHAYRLPSEAEWEYAARAGSKTAYWWGEDMIRGRANCAGCGSEFDGKKTAPADAFPPNAFGLYNMLGNAAEWVADCWTASYNGAPSDGSAWTRDRCGERVLRGGAFNQDSDYVHAAARFKYDAGVRYYANGFRVVRELQ